MGDITKNFSRHEFLCKCNLSSCDGFHISLWLIFFLQEIRDFIKSTIIITSAYRCDQHNKNISGETYSYHKIGLAVDIVCKNRYKTINYAIDKNINVIVYDNFLHLDLRNLVDKSNLHKSYNFGGCLVPGTLFLY
jgi:hypothetical protein